MSAVKLLSAAALAVCVGGCEVGPNYRVPSTSMPGTYTTATTQPATAPAAAQRPVDIQRWWQSLDDPELNSLIARGIQANLDLQIALAHLQEARTLEVVVSGGTLPVADLSGAAAKGSGTNSTKGRVGAPLNAGTNTTGLREITEVVGFDAGWEIDLFGRYRRLLEAARADTQAAAEARNSVLITVVSDIARAYTDERMLSLRLAIALDNIHTEEQVVRVVQDRFTRGLTDELDVAQARTQLAIVQATVEPLKSQIGQAQRRLAVLLGDYPGAIAQEMQKDTPLPYPPTEVQPGLPVELLRRRPDIRQAERQLAAATARIGVATSNLYPRVILTGGLGLQGQGLGRAPVENSFIWSVGPAAYWPLLDFGALDALVDIQDLQTQELLLNYKKTILNAVEEVDDAIANYAAEQEHLRSLQDALIAARRAEVLSRDQYERGLKNFLNVLDAERQLYAVQDQYAAAQGEVVIQFIAVYKSLGGGWENYQSIPPIRQPQPAIIAAMQRAIPASP